MASSSPAGKRQINWQTRNPPGTEQRTKQKLDPTGKRMVTFGQWEKRELPGPFVYMNLDGTAFPLGFGNTFLKEKGLKLAQNPEAKTRKHSSSRSPSPPSMAVTCSRRGRTNMPLTWLCPRSRRVAQVTCPAPCLLRLSSLVAAAALCLFALLTCA